MNLYQKIALLIYLLLLLLWVSNLISGFLEILPDFFKEDKTRRYRINKVTNEFREFIDEFPKPFRKAAFFSCVFFPFVFFPFYYFCMAFYYLGLGIYYACVGVCNIIPELGKYYQQIKGSVLQ